MIEIKLAHEVVSYEIKSESILSSLQNNLENDFPPIFKLKRNLIKLTENMDVAKSKLNSANHQRHSINTNLSTAISSGTTSSATAASSGKIDNCKEELEDIALKVEQCRVRSLYLNLPLSLS